MSIYIKRYKKRAQLDGERSCTKANAKEAPKRGNDGLVVNGEGSELPVLVSHILSFGEDVCFTREKGVSERNRRRSEGAIRRGCRQATYNRQP